MNKTTKRTFVTGALGLTLLGGAMVGGTAFSKAGASHHVSAATTPYFEYSLGHNGQSLTLSELRKNEAAGKDTGAFIVERLEAVLYQFAYDGAGQFVDFSQLEVKFDGKSEAYRLLEKGNAGHYELPLVDASGKQIGEYLPVDIKDTDTLVNGKNSPEVYIYNRDEIHIEGEKLQGLSPSEVEALLIRTGKIQGMDFSGGIYPVSLNFRGPEFYSLSQGIPGEYSFQFDLNCPAGATYKKIHFIVD